LHTITSWTGQKLHIISYKNKIYVRKYLFEKHKKLKMFEKISCTSSIWGCTTLEPSFSKLHTISSWTGEKSSIKTQKKKSPVQLHKNDHFSNLSRGGCTMPRWSCT
jgi:hypothetical protein